MNYLKQCSEALLLDSSRATLHLILIFILTLSNNVEELEAVLALGGADHAQPISQLLLFEELLCQVLQVSSAEFLVCHDFDAAIAEVGDGDSVAKVSCTALNLDTLLEERREGGGVEDAVLRWLGCVDDVLSHAHE